MRRPWPTFARVAVSVAVVTVLYLPFADYKWTIFKVKAFDPATGSHPVYVMAPVGDIIAPIADHTWWIFVALPEAVFGAVAAIGVFALLGLLVGKDGRRETLCRRCARVLIGLRDPACPGCGEHL